MQGGRIPTDNPVLEAIDGLIINDLRLKFMMTITDEPVKSNEVNVSCFKHVHSEHRLKCKTPVQTQPELGFITQGVLCQRQLNKTLSDIMSLPVKGVQENPMSVADVIHYVRKRDTPEPRQL
jgi:hypothetical protein